MIDQNQDGGSAPETHAQEIALPAQTAPISIRPVANHLLLDYQKPALVGQIHMPQKMRQLETITAKVLARGPDVKHIEVGQRILILAKALIGGEEGLMVDGRRCYLTQEQVVIAVVAPALTVTQSPS